MVLKRQKVLFFSTFSSPFIDIDRRIIAQFARVRSITSRGLPVFFALFWQTLFADAVVSWFVSTYGAVMVLAARVFRKKSIVVVGGADVTVDQEMGYGLLTSRWKKRLIRYALRHASAVLPVSQHLTERAKTVGEYDGNNIRQVPPGLDPDLWQPAGRKEAVILTVALCRTPERIRIKGIDILLEAARLIPQTTFRIIGVAPDVLIRMGIPAPANVTILPPSPQSELIAYYRKASVYCQPSRIESFSFALAQGMLCQCVPVATDVGGMPEVMGKTGFLVPRENPRALSEALARALQENGRAGEAARGRIQTRFSIDRRSEELEQLISG
ncbi:MAG: glycosyltransferase [Fidelibacterota bacterium]